MDHSIISSKSKSIFDSLQSIHMSQKIIDIKQPFHLQVDSRRVIFLDRFNYLSDKKSVKPGYTSDYFNYYFDNESDSFISFKSEELILLYFYTVICRVCYLNIEADSDSGNGTYVSYLHMNYFFKKDKCKSIL